MTTLHFISGLPRSGSTLLSALLLQNPRFHASITSGLAGLAAGVIAMTSRGSELSLLIDQAQRRTILSALFRSYYEGVTDRPVVFDTNRSWTTRMALLSDLYPTSKVIACVRPVPWIMDSMERQFRKQPYENTRLFPSDAERSTVYARVETLARQTSLVGYAWSGLKEAYYGEHSANLLIIDYELLARAPERVLRIIYDFVGEPWFDGHDFDTVEFDAPDFDEALGLAGLHTIRPKVRFQERKTILPPDLFQRYQGMDFWTDIAGTNATVITRKSD